MGLPIRANKQYINTRYVKHLYVRLNASSNHKIKITNSFWYSHFIPPGFLLLILLLNLIQVERVAWVSNTDVDRYVQYTVHINTVYILATRSRMLLLSTSTPASNIIQHLTTHTVSKHWKHQAFSAPSINRIIECYTVHDLLLPYITLVHS